MSYDKSPIKTEMCTTDPDTGEQICKNPINVGLYFNDVWAYELDCYREGATAQGAEAQFVGASLTATMHALMMNARTSPSRSVRK